jgi:hypothetical protein
VRDIPYYVSPSFSASYPHNSFNFQRVEKMVEQDFRDFLVNRCHVEKAKRNNLIQKVGYIYCLMFALRTILLTTHLQAAWSGTATDRESAKNTPTPSCEQYQAYFIENKGSQYLNKNKQHKRSDEF